MKIMRYILILFMGFLCFLISQVLLRVPILNNYIYTNPSIIIFQFKSPLIFGVFIAFTAGLFEETFRFIFRRFLIKDSNYLIDAAVFGLGHSFMEILYIFFPVISSDGLISISSLAILERVIATIFHVEMSILIWNGFFKKKECLYWMYAVLFHSVIDSIIVFGSYMNFGVEMIEILFLLIVILIGIFILVNNKLNIKNR